MAVYTPRPSNIKSPISCYLTISAPNPNYGRRPDVTIYYNDGSEVKSVTYTTEQLMEQPKVIEFAPQVIYVVVSHYDTYIERTGAISYISSNYVTSSGGNYECLYVFGDGNLEIS